ncbi:MAG TPA: hypothetical protein VMT03_03760 [Polyangia bacterium]|nr:hypothetical protein [Polyangia bacterium]
MQDHERREAIGQRRFEIIGQAVVVLVTERERGGRGATNQRSLSAAVVARADSVDEREEEDRTQRDSPK